MNNTSNNINTVKRGKNRLRNDYADKTSNNSTTDNVLVLLEPNINDIQDELVRMDSFAYSRYNE